MITFNIDSREVRPVSNNPCSPNCDPGFSAWLAKAPRQHPGVASSFGLRADRPPADPDSQDLDLLVSDIAKLARSYLNPGEADRADLLDAVRSLLGTALEKMRGSSDRATSGDAPAPVSRPRGGIAPSALRRVREHIEQNLGEHIEIADLATLTGLSPCHFSRAFKQSMGMPPHRYLISRRVEEAARLIESTDRPMFEIALDVGFADQSHFTRVFSSQVGESPSQFRHQRR
jgi:AraC-like DNA-binding protein